MHLKHLKFYISYFSNFKFLNIQTYHAHVKKDINHFSSFQNFQIYLYMWKRTSIIFWTFKNFQISNISCLSEKGQFIFQIFKILNISCTCGWKRTSIIFQIVKLSKISCTCEKGYNSFFFNFNFRHIIYMWKGNINYFLSS